MHVLHYVSVAADSSKEAYKNVKSILDERTSSGGFWSDWQVVGGGRWSKNSKDTYTDTPKDVISYAQEEKRFLEAVDYTKKARSSEMSGLVDRLNKEQGEATFYISMLEFIKNPDSKSLDMNAYNIYRVAEMLLGHWNPNSYYYDLEDGNGSYQYLEERIVNEPDRQYIVPVDLHF